MFQFRHNIQLSVIPCNSADFSCPLNPNQLETLAAASSLTFAPEPVLDGTENLGIAGATAVTLEILV